MVSPEKEHLYKLNMSKNILSEDQEVLFHRTFETFLFVRKRVRPDIHTII